MSGFSPTFPLTVIGIFGVFSLVQLYLYARKDTPVYCFLTAYLDVVITFSTAVLLPYDICVTVDENGHSPSIALLWRTIYWCLVVFNWILLPIFIEHQRTGNWRESVIMNSLYWVAYAVIGFISLAIYLAQVGFTSLSEIYNFFYSLSFAGSNAYGLGLISILLGYAFVALPQYLYLISQPQKHLDRLYANVVEADEYRLSSKFDLEDRFNMFRQVAPPEAPSARAAEIAETAARFLNKALNDQAGHLRPRRQEEEAKSFWAQAAGKTSELGRLGDALNAAESAVCKFDGLVDQCIELEAYLAKSLSPLQMQLFDAKLIFARISSYACGFLSVVIIMAQATIFIPLWWLSLLAVAYREVVVHLVTRNDSSEAWGSFLEVLVGIPLVYGYLASFWAAFRFKLSLAYGLYPKHNTHPYSLMWCASVMSRIAMSLCYNYIYMLRMQHDSVKTAFMTFSRTMSMVPFFGSTFVNVLPFLIVIFAVMQYTNTYHRMMHYLGLSGLQMESAVIVGRGEQVKAEGKRIVAREKSKRSGASQPSSLGKPAGSLVNPIQN